MGLLCELILSKEVFAKNRDLTEFIKKVFNKEYNDYLFKSRPYLASRIMKYVSDEFDNSNITSSLKMITLFLDEKKSSVELKGNIQDSKERIPSNNSIHDDIIGWFNSVSSGNDR